MSKGKRQEIENLYEDLDAGLDADEFARLERTAPWLTEIICQLVSKRQTPEGISAHVFIHYPHQWITAQSIRAAARHAVREIG